MGVREEEKDNRPEVDLLLRKSKIVREGERALSLRAQEERGRSWADANGYRVRKVWKENLSAWSDVERPKYDAAMAAVLNGEVPALWCYALDRFSRKGAEAVVPILGKARVIFDYEDLDSMNERDRRWIIDRAENAREYSVRLSYNVRQTKNRQRNEGRWLSRAPFGLIADKVTRKLSPNREKVAGKTYCPWDLIVRIFTSIAEGVSARGLARQFNSEGIKSATGKGWRADVIRAIVIHPAYEGWLTVSPGGKSHKAPQLYYNPAGERVQVAADMQEMIPADLAERARRVLSGHQILPRKSRPGRPSRLLVGRLVCAHCDHAMRTEGKSYNCQMRAVCGDCPSPASAWCTAIENYVMMRWLARFTNTSPTDPLLRIVAERWDSLTRPQETKEHQDAIAAVKAAEAAIEQLADDRAAGLYAGAMGKHFPRLVQDAEAKLTVAQERAEKLSDHGSVDIAWLLNPLWTQRKWQDAGPELKRDLIGLAIDRITVTRAPKRGVRFNGWDRVEITWADGAADYAYPAFREGVLKDLWEWRPSAA
ncbi:recombinase family protein [Streptomyces sp. NPDC048172]|uniref:recombinase family protein n=1 Tax=Streptomyces sp. NPDC048172 TaxID=3365505 RepID=UPI003716CEAB